MPVIGNDTSISASKIYKNYYSIDPSVSVSGLSLSELATLYELPGTSIKLSDFKNISNTKLKYSRGVDFNGVQFTTNINDTYSGPVSPQIYSYVYIDTSSLCDSDCSIYMKLQYTAYIERDHVIGGSDTIKCRYKTNNDVIYTDLYSIANGGSTPPYNTKQTGESAEIMITKDSSLQILFEVDTNGDTNYNFDTSVYLVKVKSMFGATESNVILQSPNKFVLTLTNDPAYTYQMSFT